MPLHMGPLSYGDSILKWLLPEAKLKARTCLQRVNPLIPELRLTGS